MGNPRNLTVEAKEAIEAAELLVGASRMIAPYQDRKRCVETYRTEEIVRLVEKERDKTDGAASIAVLMSGDSGFYSGTRHLIAALDALKQETAGSIETAEYALTVLPGVSSLSYFCARIGKAWEDVKIVNLHGADENLWRAVMTHEKVFAVTGGNVKEQLQILAGRGMGDSVCGYVGENLSYEKERIMQGTAAQLAEHEYDKLAVLYLENPQAAGINLTGLPDESFVRGETPMTKAEVRSVVMSRLRIRDRDIVYDIGAGTGSVSVEMALAASKGKVYAVESDRDAVELCKRNAEKFGLHNIEIVEGTAPNILKELPVPDAAFVGGTKGRLPEIIAVLTEKNPAIRLVVNTVTVENTQSALKLLDTDAFIDMEAVQLQVNRIKKAGSGHMVTAQNPITILSARGSGAERADDTIGQNNVQHTEDSKKVQSSGILIAGTGSGSGKTTLVSGLLHIMKMRGLNPCSFKCGPDYIDPSFHKKVTGEPCCNLDPFFTDEAALRRLYERHKSGHGISVIEGVMGYYDGLGFTDEASTYSVAKALQVPVVLLADCKGMGNSVMATVEGFLRHGGENLIKGVIFNRIAPTLYEKAAQAARALGVIPLGYLPDTKELSLESRHLGLVMADEVTDFEAVIGRIGDAVGQTADVDGILKLAGVEKREGGFPSNVIGRETEMSRETENDGECTCRIAVAQDEAFCFLYEDNLHFLREHGAQIVPFSPLHDSALPVCDALYLSGGYPELYAEKLAENSSMRRDVKDKIESGMPCIAECGGFLYLHDKIESAEHGEFYKMTGVIKADAIYKRRKGRFGYIEVTPERDCLLGRKGDTFRAHEFHYWESTGESVDLTVLKPGSGASWREGVCTDTLYAGFPHLYFYGSPKVGESFIKAACEYSHRQGK